MLTSAWLSSSTTAPRSSFITQLQCTLAQIPFIRPSNIQRHAAACSIPLGVRAAPVWPSTAVGLLPGHHPDCAQHPVPRHYQQGGRKQRLLEHSVPGSHIRLPWHLRVGDREQLLSAYCCLRAVRGGLLHTSRVTWSCQLSASLLFQPLSCCTALLSCRTGHISVLDNRRLVECGALSGFWGLTSLSSVCIVQVCLLLGKCVNFLWLHPLTHAGKHLCLHHVVGICGYQSACAARLITTKAAVQRGLVS